MRVTIVVLEEGNQTLQRLPQCDMFVSWEALKISHLAMAMCAKGVEQKRRRWVEEEAHAITTEVFHSYVKSLEAMNSFKYQGSVLTASAKDWPMVVNNLMKAWRKWTRLSSILGR